MDALVFFCVSSVARYLGPAHINIVVLREGEQGARAECQTTSADHGRRGFAHSRVRWPGATFHPGVDCPSPLLECGPRPWFHQPNVERRSLSEPRSPATLPSLPSPSAPLLPVVGSDGLFARDSSSCCIFEVTFFRFVSVYVRLLHFLL